MFRNGIKLLLFASAALGFGMYTFIVPTFSAPEDPISFYQSGIFWMWVFIVLTFISSFDFWNRLMIYNAWVREGKTQDFFSSRFPIMRGKFLMIVVGMLLVTVLAAVPPLFTMGHNGVIDIAKTTQESAFKSINLIYLIKLLVVSLAIGGFYLINTLYFLNKGEWVLGVADTESEGSTERKWLKFFQVKGVETDKDMLIDHPHDDIYELDNPPPPWFMGLFYGTIGFGVIYIFYFSFLSLGATQAQEYDQQVESAKIEVDKYLEKVAAGIDENSVVLEADAGRLKEAQAIFAGKCATCHGAKGEGIAGPNLTDDYWLHGGGLKNVFKTIKYGVQGKAMIAWKDEIPPHKMQALASYVLSLKGSNPPNPKAPEGKLYDENAAAAPAPATDSIAKDTAKVVK